MSGPGVQRAGADAAMNVLELRRVSKTYGQGAAEVHALSNVDLSVGAGARHGCRARLP